MAYLDVSPMIVALRERPDEFEQRGKWLLHTPSRHSFRFDCEGNVRLRASCKCALLSIEKQQGQVLWQAFQDWHQAYWWPTVVNRQFALHFRRPSLWRRLIRGVLSLFDKSQSLDVESSLALLASALVHKRAKPDARR